jgi:hypothetical protein
MKKNLQSLVLSILFLIKVLKAAIIRCVSYKYLEDEHEFQCSKPGYKGRAISYLFPGFTVSLWARSQGLYIFNIL